jgi:AbrB family looped-hinge helix DNA binding protein
MSRATIASKGQITIPKDIRDLLSLHSGDKVNFFVDEFGAVHFLPVNRDVSTLKGLDTNILVRYIVQDDPKQAAVATDCIERQCTAESPCFIGHIFCVN